MRATCSGQTNRVKRCAAWPQVPTTLHLYLIKVFGCEGIRNWVAAKVIPDQPGSPRSAKEDENLPKGESVTLFRSLKDAPRAVDTLLLAPR